jgi:hypothetical protein
VNKCGNFSIVAQFNSDASTIVGDPVDLTQTNLVALNSTNLKFASNQLTLSGTLKYNVVIVSSTGV